MSYRYARSNGQFLESKFKNSSIEKTELKFRADESYDLTRDIVSGSSINENSFISDNKIAGYEGKNKLGSWWRIADKSNASVFLVEDSSNNTNWLTGALGTSPTLDLNDTPTSFVSRNSFLFDGTNDNLSLTGSNFIFAESGKDKPFSLMLSVKPSTLTNSLPLMSVDNSDNLLWYVYFESDGKVKLFLNDKGLLTTANIYTSPGALTVDTWNHVVFTYDGRAGATAGNGLSIYIDGSKPSTTNWTGGSYTSMHYSSEAVLNIGGGQPSLKFNGNIADVAIWNKELTSSDVSHLYGVKNAGAYRLVRDYGKVSIDNDTRLIGVATGKKGFDTTSLPKDILNQYQQGKDIRTFDQLLNYNAVRIRSNNNFEKTLNGRAISRTTFDESLAVTTLSSGDNVSYVTLGGNGRLSERLVHEREYRDLGQTLIYDNSVAYEDTLDLNAVAIVSKRPETLVLPLQLVSQTSNELMDGVIEPLVIREMVDGSSTESPYYAHTFRASIGGIIDAYRRSILIVDGKDLDEPLKGAAPFLDSVENFGDLDQPGSFSNDIASIEPYVDYLNDRDKEYTTNSISVTISNMLIHSSSWTDNDSREYDKMSSRGFVFDNNPIGIDSIAYGGLKK